MSWDYCKYFLAMLLSSVLLVFKSIFALCEKPRELSRTSSCIQGQCSRAWLLVAIEVSVTKGVDYCLHSLALDTLLLSSVPGGAQSAATISIMYLPLNTGIFPQLPATVLQGRTNLKEGILMENALIDLQEKPKNCPVLSSTYHCCSLS